MIAVGWLFTLYSTDETMTVMNLEPASVYFASSPDIPIGIRWTPELSFASVAAGVGGMYLPQWCQNSIKSFWLTWTLLLSLDWLKLGEQLNHDIICLRLVQKNINPKLLFLEIVYNQWSKHACKHCLKNPAIPETQVHGANSGAHAATILGTGERFASSSAGPKDLSQESAQSKDPG